MFSISLFSRARLASTALALLAIAFAVAGCADDPGGERVENQPPRVWLSSAPPEGTATKYRIQLFWGGWDPDGEIAYYEYAITDNETGTFDEADTTGADKWHRVVGNDSTFTFTADVWADSNETDLVSRFERSHTFFIRAVDEQGMSSREPAYRSFTSWTLSPEVSILVPRAVGLTPALVPAIATYRWSATDFVNTKMEIQDPDSVRWILHPVENNDFAAGLDYVRKSPDSDEWSDWVYYRAPNDSGKYWTTPPTDLGPYVFAVQAKDEAGAVTPVFDEKRNIRRIRVSQRSTGPIMDVYNEFTGSMRTSVVNTPTVIIDLPAGVPMQFTISATAEHYGGLVSGYRYGWDIGDLADPEQWEVDYTPFTTEKVKTPPRTYYFGTHTFNCEVIDNSGARSRAEIKVNVVQFSMERPLLFVDDFEPGSAGLLRTNGAVPNDAEHDAFWEAMLADVAGFEFDTDALTVKLGDPVSIVKFATYKSIIWDSYGNYNSSASARPKLYDLIRFRSKDPTKGQSTGKVQPNLLTLFVRAGGHLFLCGTQPMTQSIAPGFFSSGERYPFIFKYELEGNQRGTYPDQVNSAVGDLSFPYQDACLNVLDIAYPGISELRSRVDNGNGCSVNTLRQISPQQEGLREALPLEGMFPRLELRPEVAGTGRAYAPDKKGLNSELYNPPYFEGCNAAEIKALRSCFQPLYGHACLNTASPLYNAPVMFRSTRYADIVPEGPDDGIMAPSFYMGVEPFYFKPDQVKEMIDIILFDEWMLPRIN